MVTTQSLFGTGIIGLLEEKELQIVKAQDVRSAINLNAKFQADVIVYFREKQIPEEEMLLQELISRYHTRVIHCTLEADQLTILEKTRIKNATVEDLMSAVMK